MIKLLLDRKKLIDYLYNWIIILEGLWICVATKLFWNVAFHIMFDIKYEHLFQECDFLKSALNIELITESGNSQNELDFGVFSLYNLGIIFEFKHDSS